jgi:drug/metabolite transporter (DMT)-like permease
MIALAGTITLPAIGHLAYKLFVQRRTRGLAMLAISLFALTSICTYLALQGLPLGLVYASSALTQAVITYLGWRYLRERITWRHLCAISLIMAGVALFGVGSFHA